jgi:hypothetical protein
MVCIFENFDREILNMPLPYKYVIHSPKDKKPEDYYEYLHARSHFWTTTEYNRCLIIQAKDQQFPTGMRDCCMFDELTAYFVSCISHLRMIS